MMKLNLSEINFRASCLTICYSLIENSQESVTCPQIFYGKISEKNMVKFVNKRTSEDNDYKYKFHFIFEERDIFVHCNTFD